MPTMVCFLDFMHQIYILLYYIILYMGVNKNQQRVKIYSALWLKNSGKVKSYVKRLSLQSAVLFDTKKEFA